MTTRQYNVAPDKNWLERKTRDGLTQQQMVDAWEEDSGYRMSRSAIAMAMARYGVASAHPRPRYEDMLPWRVSDEHRMAADARLLRLEARRRKGEKLTADELRWLTGWRERLREANAVIHYDPNTVEGFFWLERDDSDDDIIRRPKD